MSTKNNAASKAVKAAALPATATQAKPCDVFDCIAMGIPREDWERALNNDEARAWSAWLAQGTPVAPVSKPQASAFPAVQQTMRLACAMATNSLKKTLKEAETFDVWSNEYGDAISTAELAMMAVERLAETLSSAGGLDTFNTTWWRVSAAVRLARDANPFKDDLIGRYLNGAANEFETLGAVVEFASFCPDREGGAT